MMNRYSNIGPPRMAPCSLGLVAKPTAMVPPCSASSRRLISSATAMPSQGTSACSIPGSLRRKREPVATIRWSLRRLCPLSVRTVRPPSASPVAEALMKLTLLRSKKRLSGNLRSSPLTSPVGIQIVLGR